MEAAIIEVRLAERRDDMQNIRPTTSSERFTIFSQWPTCATTASETAVFDSGVQVESRTYPPHCKTQQDKQRYLSIVAQIPSYDELMQIVVDPPAEWLAEKD
jgi:hypothetical protein